MNISTLEVTSSPTQIFQTPYRGYYTIYIKENGGNNYTGGVSILDHGTGLNIITENVDFRGFIAFPRYINSTSCHFYFEPSRIYNITKIGDLYFINLVSGSDINVTFTCVEKQLTNQVLVGPNGDFTTLKVAVDWFNLYAIENTEIVVDGGPINIDTTITINSNLHIITVPPVAFPFNLVISGLGYDVTIFTAIAGGSPVLTGTPIFNIASECTIQHFGTDTSQLLNYGTLIDENFITYDTTSDIYCEFRDFIIDGFYIGFSDIIGVSFFAFDFEIDNCISAGVRINYTQTTPAIPQQSLDLEVGNFVNCHIGVDLLQTGQGSAIGPIQGQKQSFFLSQLIFENVNITDIGIKYTGPATPTSIGYYYYENLANITGCSYNFVGLLATGFDFTIPRDANIEITGNIGIEDKSPHMKQIVVDNALPTPLTTQNVYYKANFTNTQTYTCKFGISGNQLTYYPSHIYDLACYISGNIRVDNNNRNLIVAVRRTITTVGDGTTVSGDGTTTTVTTSSPHHLITNTIIQNLGWTPILPVTINGVKIITVTSTTTFTFPSTLNGSVTGGTIGAMLGGMTIRTITSNISYQYSTNVYLQNLSLNEILELYISNSSASGDTATLDDLNLMIRK